MNARRTMQEKQEKKEEITKRLDKLQRTSDDVLLKMTNTLDDRIEKIVDGLHQFLSSPSTMERLNEWNTAELPDGDDMDDIENRARTMIQKVITDEVRDWESANHNFSKARQELYEYFKREFNFLDEELRRVEGSLQDDGFSGDGAQNALPQMTDEPLFNSTEKLVLGLTAPLWVPLALVATIIALPIIGGIAIREKVKQDKQLREYKQNKLGTMKKWFRETIEDLDSEALKERVVEIQLASLREIIEHIRKLIPRLIDADRKLIEDVVHDERSEGELVRIFSPLYKQCERLHGRIQLFHARYMRHFTIHKSDIIEKKWIASGSFAEVYDASVRINGEVQRVALKQMKEALKYHNAGDYFMEEDTLIRLQGSPNIVGYIGTIYQTEPDERLIMITELCAKTLKVAIFKDPNKQPARWSGEAQRKAFAYVSNMAAQLAVAIDYIHKKGFIHRDLKMDNILLTDNDEDVTKQDTLKLSDVGLTKAESQITGTLCGTIAYSAPEVLAGMAYNKQADLYSFGLILWEMWYGVKVFPDLHANHFEFMQYVLDGMRPEFTMRNRSPPPKEWKEIMERCWESQPEKRPSASECYTRLSLTASDSFIRTAFGS
ncbi:fibroblast growth factor receptor 4-like isoform X1 [Lingula anatina]|uniref:Fibroblast growth factor receptor 4-like isoform X1 n=1 Tax=Lingula anatina TaxID=7574 RepID=A0A1S3JC90_LINAN|nr:fibroblast growth factor receptor 4-like isoform X1 [Lingula anatina]|eukprot:XP_013408025.1 fibroblast growth factor receptor 4-like isoform X1 [Lingula anatina]